MIPRSRTSQTSTAPRLVGCAAPGRPGRRGAAAGPQERSARARQEPTESGGSLQVVANHLRSLTAGGRCGDGAGGSHSLAGCLPQLQGPNLGEGLAVLGRLQLRRRPPPLAAAGVSSWPGASPAGASSSPTVSTPACRVSPWRAAPPWGAGSLHGAFSAPAGGSSPCTGDTPSTALFWLSVTAGATGPPDEGGGGRLLHTPFYRHGLFSPALALGVVEARRLAATRPSQAAAARACATRWA